MSPKKIGRYDILGVLGKGAMGIVYEGHDPNIDRPIALKTILVQHLSDELANEFETRFRSEARAAGRLQHPNIVGVYDAGRDAGLAYLVMELVRGDDLKKRLDRGEHDRRAEDAEGGGDHLARDLPEACAAAGEVGHTVR